MMATAVTTTRGLMMIHSGSARLPPMVQVDGTSYGLDRGIVKPPSPEELWDWYVQYGYDKADPDPSWGKIWDSAAHLALRLRSTDDVCRGKRVVELGSGLGIVGCVAAKTAAKTIFVDREPFALHCACSTAALNGLKVGDVHDDKPVAAVKADFGNFSFPNIDLIVASDVLYDHKQAMDDFAKTCDDLLRPQNGIALIADPLNGRAFGARDHFLSALRHRGATVSDDILLKDRLEPTLLLTIHFPTTSSPPA